MEADINVTDRRRSQAGFCVVPRATSPERLPLRKPRNHEPRNQLRAGRKTGVQAIRASHRRPGAGQVLRDPADQVFADADGVGHGGEGRVHRSDAGEKLVSTT